MYSLEALLNCVQKRENTSKRIIMNMPCFVNTCFKNNKMDNLQDYQDLKVPLTDIPVNPCTTSELVRLCLRKQDVDDANSDNSDEDLVNEDDEVVRNVY